MRRVWLLKEDFGLFHQDITPQEYEFFRTHAGAFKRMWHEQSRRFWSLFVNAFEHFIWNYGVMKDFPMKVEEVKEYIDEIVFYIRDHFVDGRISTAKNLVMDCVIVTQNRNCIALLDRASYAQNPFYKKETREIFRQLFGPPDDRRTFMKVLCGLPVYIKFAGAAVAVLRRWLKADDIPSDDAVEAEFLANVHSRTYPTNLSLEYDEDLLKSVSILGTDGPKLLSSDLSRAMSKSTGAKTAVDSVSAGMGEEKAASSLKKKRKKKKKKSSQAELSPSEVAKEIDRGGGGGGGVVKTKLLENTCDGAGSKDTAVGLVCNGTIDTDGRESCASDETTPTTTATSTPSSDDVIGVELVAKEENVDKNNVNEGPSAAKGPNVAAGVEERRKKLHSCSNCGKAETTAKTFKRCQMCRGKPHPKYYCSKECQTKHWKLHKQDHREDQNNPSAANSSHV